jgi:hypothetical protein
MSPLTNISVKTKHRARLISLLVLASGLCAAPGSARATELLQPAPSGQIDALSTPPALPLGQTEAPLPTTQAPPPGAPAPPAASSPPVAHASPKPPTILPPLSTATPVPPATQLKIELGNGTSMRFGLLWDAQFEALGNPANDDLSKNLFLRRFALLVGGTVLTDIEYFYNSDFSDLFKASGVDGVKNGPGFATKDAFVTYRAVGDQLKIDAGFMLPPGARNSHLGAVALHGLDNFKNTYRHAAAFGSSANSFGRDTGVQLRGLLAGGLLEYRLGTFQGRRNPPLEGPPARAAARNSFRFAGRVQLNLLDPETGFFYFGTYLGKKQVLALGASADYQHASDGSYRAFAVDGALDVSAGPGGLTAEVDLIHRNGGSLVSLPEQTAFEAEAGYRFDALRSSPIVRYEQRWVKNAPGDETAVGAGLAFWAYGQTSNLKAFYQRVSAESPGSAYHQFNLQWHLAFF